MPSQACACAKIFAAFFLLLSCLVCSGQTTPPAKPVASGSVFKVVRSVSGAAGHEDSGRFVMEDPRSVFTPGKDAKVIVSFEWEGPLGPHHFEGLWKGPEGKIMLISDFRYEAKGPR